jgi:enterochelin esterase-like enzyme
MLQSFQSTVARRRLLLGSAIGGLGALIGGQGNRILFGQVMAGVSPASN